MAERFPDVDALALFVGVCETGSISAAARAFGLTQPAATERIRRLERRLGLSLLHRTPTGSSPTETGAAVEAWAREVVACCDRLVESARTLRKKAGRVTLRVTASYTTAEYLLPEALVDLRRRSPGVTISLSVENSVAVLDAVLGGRCQLGFVEGEGVPRFLRHRTVATDRLVVIAAAGNPVGRRPLTPSKLVSHPLVLREPGSGTREVFVAALEAAGTALPATALEIGSTAAIMRAVAAGDALGVVSEFAMRARERVGDLKTVPTVGLDLGRSLRAVWRKEGDRVVAEVVAAAARAGRRVSTDTEASRPLARGVRGA